MACNTHTQICARKPRSDRLAKRSYTVKLRVSQVDEILSTLPWPNCLVSLVLPLFLHQQLHLSFHLSNFCLILNFVLQYYQTNSHKLFKNKHYLIFYTTVNFLTLEFLKKYAFEKAISNNGCVITTITNRNVPSGLFFVFLS